MTCCQQATGLEATRNSLPSPPRRAKTSKGDAGLATPSDDSVDSAKAGPQSLTATGLKMTLNGVEPLGPDSRMTWQTVTRDFIEANVWKTQDKVDKLQVNVNFANQDPPFISRRRLTDDITGGGSSLRRTLARILQEKQLGITFDVDMVLESNEPGNALNLVTTAFDADGKRADYIQRLKETGDPAFASVSMNTSLEPTSAPATTGGKTIGIIVGITIVVLIIVGCVAYVIQGQRSTGSEPQDVSDAKCATDDESSSPEEEHPVPVPEPEDPMPRTSPPLGTRRNDDIPQTIVVDDASTYFDGNISVAWSLDTENQATQISNLS